MATILVFPQIVLHSPEDVPPEQLARLTLAFAAAFALQNGNQIVIAKAVWDELAGKQIHMEFEARSDRFIMRVEQGDYVEIEEDTDAVPEPNPDRAAKGHDGDALAHAQEGGRDS